MEGKAISWVIYPTSNKTNHLGEGFIYEKDDSTTIEVTFVLKEKRLSQKVFIAGKTVRRKENNN